MKILLADDHELVRDGLKPILGRLGEAVEVVECDSFHAAIAQASRQDGLDLAILDLRMPGMNGFAGVASFTERFPEVPVAILSGVSGRAEVMGAMRAGARAFIPKTTGGPAILSALRLVLCGERFFPPELIVADPAPRAACDGMGQLAADLNDKEREVVRLVLDGTANKEIGRLLGIEEITVKKRLSGAYRKLGVANRFQLMQLVQSVR